MGPMAAGRCTAWRWHAWAAALALVIYTKLAVAQLPFTTSYPQQCTPLNVTWTPDPDAYPYSIYILGVGSSILSYIVDKDYQPNAKQVTFQYLVPKPSMTFNSFVVAIADSKGRGNSSYILPVNDGDEAPDDCTTFPGANQWFYAADSKTGQPGDRISCEPLRYYPIPPLIGTAPFSLSLVPLGGAPITVNVPKSALTNSSFFIYESIMPLAEGTQFLQFMSDEAGGGSGGGSILYTARAGSDSSCLASNYALASKNSTNLLPIGSRTAVFANLDGALSAQKPQSNPHGSLIGGIIGAVIGVGAISVLIIGYLIYRRRQKKKRELARKEQPQFVDLDDDDYSSNNNSGGALAGGNRRGRHRDGVQQSYSVSPFTYEAAHNSSTTPSNNVSSELTPFRNGAEGDFFTAAAYSPNALRPMSTTTSEFNASTRHSGHPLHEPSSANSYNNSYFAVPLPDRDTMPTQNFQNGTGENSRQRAQHARSGTDSPPESSYWHSTAATSPPAGQGRQSGADVNSMYSGHSLAQPALPMAAASAAVGGSGAYEAYPMQERVRRFTSSSNGPASTNDVFAAEGLHRQTSGSTRGSASNADAIEALMMHNSPPLPADHRRSTFMQHRDAGPVRPEDYMEEMPPSYGQWITPPSQSNNKEGGSKLSTTSTNVTGNPDAGGGGG